VMGLFAGDSGHIHSWSSIFVQDVVLPLRRTPLTERQHMWALRLAVVGVAAFAFMFSLLFRQTQYIQMWWNLTSAVFVGGAGAAIIGGLYWRRGTTQAAWAAMIAGAACALSGILVTNGGTWKWTVATMSSQYDVTLPAKFWLNGTEMAFLASSIAVCVYVVVSLFTCRQPFDLERMLHRGKWAVEPEGGKPFLPLRERFSLRRILDQDSNFTRGDKLVSGGLFAFAMLLLGVNLVVTAWNLLVGNWSTKQWAHYWLIFTIVLPFVVAFFTLFWFGVGGTRDIIRLFASLRTMKRDATDDGRVEGQPAAEAEGSFEPVTASLSEPVPTAAAAIITPAK
jgi:SSS family solute:Na+ symporter